MNTTWKVAYRQQISLARFEPYARSGALAPRAVTVAAGVVGNPPVPAVGAGLGVAPECSGATMLDRQHHFELVRAQMPCVGGSVRRTGGAEDVGDLERGAHLAQPAGGPVRVWPCISAISRSSGPVTAWIVRVATLV